MHKKLLSIMKKAPPSLKADLNKEDELLTYKLEVDDRIEKFNRKVHRRGIKVG